MRRFLVPIIALMLLAFANVPKTDAASYWRNMYMFCPNGAQVSVSASGNVSVIFYYSNGRASVPIGQNINFGWGQSRIVTTSLRASYIGVSVSGSGVNQVGTPTCR